MQLSPLRSQKVARMSLGLMLAGALIACSPSTPHLSATVDYYRTHAAEREAMLKGCGNDPGGFGQAADCVNAREAERLEGVGSLRALPPMGLPAAPAAAEGAPPARRN
jgi:hypothetical protein